MRNFLLITIILLVIISCDHDDRSSVEETMISESYENGALKRKYFTLDGRKNGFDSTFYEDGQLKSFYQWSNDTLIFESFEYLNSLTPMLVTEELDTFITNIPILSTYQFYNNAGDVSFTANYDSTYNPNLMDGDGIASIFLNVNNDEASCLIAEPPMLKTRVIIRPDTPVFDPDTLLPKSNLIRFNFNKYQDHNIIMYFESFNESINHIDSILISTDRSSIKRY